MEGILWPSGCTRTRDVSEEKKVVSRLECSRYGSSSPIICNEGAMSGLKGYCEAEEVEESALGQVSAASIRLGLTPPMKMKPCRRWSS